MGIYIKKMDMPKSCIECLLHEESVCKAFTTIEPWTFKDDERAAFCPLTEVPESKWIPCSEKLPSERGWYLITVQGMNRFTDMDYYYGNAEWDEVSSKQKVIAWMPLPEPYREDGEE